MRKEWNVQIAIMAKTSIDETMTDVYVNKHH